MRREAAFLIEKIVQHGGWCDSPMLAALQWPRNQHGERYARAALRSLAQRGYVAALRMHARKSFYAVTDAGFFTAQALYEISGDRPSVSQQFARDGKLSLPSRFAHDKLIAISVGRIVGRLSGVALDSRWLCRTACEFQRVQGPTSGKLPDAILIDDTRENCALAVEAERTRKTGKFREGHSNWATLAHAIVDAAIKPQGFFVWTNSRSNVDVRRYIVCYEEPTIRAGVRHQISTALRAREVPEVVIYWSRAGIDLEKETVLAGR